MGFSSSFHLLHGSAGTEQCLVDFWVCLRVCLASFGARQLSFLGAGPPAPASQGRDGAAAWRDSSRPSAVGLLSLSK